jgi:ABC-type Fe3+-citrate transport system substrate-binding protein
MKKINLKLMIALISGSLILASCGDNSNSENDAQHHEEGMEHDHSNHEHGSTDEKKKCICEYG